MFFNSLRLWAILKRFTRGGHLKIITEKNKVSVAFVSGVSARHLSNPLSVYPAERQLKCNTGDDIVRARGRYGPDPLGGTAVDPTSTPHPPESDGGSTWVRHDRGGVDVDSLMQTTEDALAVSCELDHFTTSTVQGAEPVDVTSDVLAGKVS